MVFAVFDIFLLIFGQPALVVASLGMINTLVMAILERRREIGILKALGASDRDVSRLFFVEAGAMGLLGGILGVVMGFADRSRDQFRHECLSSPPRSSRNQRHRRSLVDGRHSNFILHRRQHAGRLISGHSRCAS